MKMQKKTQIDFYLIEIKSDFFFEFLNFKYCVNKPATGFGRLIIYIHAKKSVIFVYISN
jgi:hypothetical protein